MSAPEHLAPGGQRERDLVQAVDADDLLDHVDLARDVAGAPRRHGDDAGALLDLEAEPLEDPRAGRSSGISSPVTASVRSGRSRDHGPAGQVALDVASRRRSARLRQLDEQLGRVDRGLLGQVRVDALLPAVRALGAQPRAARSCA